MPLGAERICKELRRQSRYARKLKRDQGGPRGARGCARRAEGGGAGFRRSRIRRDWLSAGKRLSKRPTYVWFHNWILLPVTIGISLLVLGLIAYIVYRFNETANPVPSRRTHNGLLEFAWTVVPALVLVVIAVPSFRLLADQLIIPAPDLTLKVTASQWHWNYGYPKSEGGFSFNSLYVEDKDLKPGQPRLIIGRQRDGGSRRQGG